MRVLPIAALALSLSATAFSGCAPAAGTPAVGTNDAKTAARCFRTDSVRNFRVDRQSDLYIRSLRNDVFLVSSGGCPDLDSAISIALTPTSGGSDNLCVGDPVRVIVPGSTMGRDACRAFVTKSLSADEVAALPDSARP